MESHNLQDIKYNYKYKKEGKNFNNFISIKITKQKILLLFEDNETIEIPINHLNDNEEGVLFMN